MRDRKTALSMLESAVSVCGSQASMNRRTELVGPFMDRYG